MIGRHPPSALPVAAIALLVAVSAAAADRTWRNPKDDMEFVWIPAGNFQAEVPRDVEGKMTFAVEPVVVDRGFWLGRTDVTVDQFRRFVQATGHVTDAEKAGNRWSWSNPGFPQEGGHPVVYLGLADAEAYATWSGTELPTDAEWLYACRAGTTNRFYWGDEMDDRHVWHRGNTEATGTRPVAAKLPNPWGLYDMVGNAWEYCRISGGGFAVKGGSWTRCVAYRSRQDIVTGNLFIEPVAPRISRYDPNPQFPPYPWDDDRGFRCIKHVKPWTPNRPAPASTHRITARGERTRFIPEAKTVERRLICLVQIL